MLLYEPAQTPYDLNFRLGPFPVRITPWFWLMALLLGGGGFRDGPFLLIWILVVLISLLVHELGHAMAYRWYGLSAHIVLYHMGGLAVSDQFGSPWQVGRQRRDPQRDLVISLAGPLTQLGSAILVAAVIWGIARSQSLPISSWQDLIVSAHAVLKSPQLTGFALQYLYVSVIWAVLNLLPVFPLDGGQIARNLFLMYGGANAIPHSLMLSLATGGLVALYGFTRGQPFLGMLFALFAYGSYQALEQYRGGFGGWRF